MSRICQLTGKHAQVGNRVSHSKVKTKHRFLPNVQKKRCWSDSLKKFVSLRLSTNAIRTIDKLGLDNYVHRLGIKLK